MNKIYYRYGTMYSGKSLNLISTYHTFLHNNRKVLVLKPALDTRDIGVIKSRMSNETVECKTFLQEDNIEELVKNYIKITKEKPDMILIDEVQFCTVKQIEEINKVSIIAPIICYGLKTSYNGELFPSINKLISLVEDMAEIKTVCGMCNKKATHNLLTINNKPIYDGNLVNIENNKNNEKYIAVCREHFYYPVLTDNNKDK